MSPTEAIAIRIESKLTRLMLGLGMDKEGNPISGVLVVDKPLADDIIEALDSFLLLIDNRSSIAEEVTDEKFGEVEALYNKLVRIRNGRWPPTRS